MTNFNESPHRRYNILTGEWILVSPHRTKRPWQGKNEEPGKFSSINYDENCYLCPGNTRANDVTNPKYTKPYSFVNDFSALLSDVPKAEYTDGLLKAEAEYGICKVLCFSPNHSLTLPLMSEQEIVQVVDLWQSEFSELKSDPNINYVQIFENKGAIMGCSNPHPHGQIWSQRSLPMEIVKKTQQQLKHWEKTQSSLLGDYLEQELDKQERILYADEHVVVLVPYWAVWPYEAMIIPKRKMAHIDEMMSAERSAFAKAIKLLTTKYDNVFKTSFPYSAGIHQAPCDGEDHPEWHLHMSFYPPLLRSATVKKFMVGYEMFATPQRDITAEQAAETIRSQSATHYSLVQK